MPELTEKQKRFCEEYLVDLNATAAYRRAGYAAKDADVCAAKLLVNAGIQAYVSERIQKRTQKHEITAERVLGELAKISFAQSEDEIGMPMKLSDKVKSLDLLGQYLKLFTKRVEVAGAEELIGKLNAGRTRIAKPQLVNGHARQ